MRLSLFLIAGHQFVSKAWGLACVLALAAVGTTAQAVEQRVNLPDGSYVTVDPDYDMPGTTPVENVGMVRWYDTGGNLLHSIHGSTANDQVGSGGVTVIGNEHFLVSSPLWDNGAVADAGALTFSEVPLNLGGNSISAANSVVGSATGDLIVSGNVAVVGSGFVVSCPLWDNGAATDAGAVILGGPYIPFGIFRGVVSSSNALMGSSANDQVGSGGLIPGLGGSLLIHSPLWDNGGAVNAGAVTVLMPPGNPGAMIGVVSSSNSLVGSSADDQIGSGGIIPVPGASAVIHSPLWDKAGAADAGAVTVLGLPGRPETSAGVISAANSLVGSSTGDQIGSGGVTLTGGVGILVSSPLWDNAGTANAGAVTLMGLPESGVVASGVVSATNSLVGSSADDQVGSGGIAALGETDICVQSPLWDNGSATNAGAVTILSPPWMGGVSAGVLSAANSLVGFSAQDQVGSGGVSVVEEAGVLVCSPLWDNGGAADAGAVTILTPAWMGMSPSSGVVSAANSLVGSSAGDQVGSGGVSADEKAGIVVRSPLWDNTGAADAGAVTILGLPWLGPPAANGAVSAANSLVGSTSGDQVGSGGVTLFDEAVCVVSSPLWDNGGAANAGAVTLIIDARFRASYTGVVSAANSLVGSSTNDQVGSGGIMTVDGFTFLVRSPQWDNGSAADAGAVTQMGPPALGIPSNGPVSATNSLVGASANDKVGSGEIKLLDDGVMFLVSSPEWSNGAGAVTRGGFPFIDPLAGTVSAANSLVGSTANDKIGSGGITLLGEGRFLVHSPLWNNGSAAEAGALTLCLPPWEGAFGGVVSAANSLVGSSTGDQVGGTELVLVEGTSTFIVHSPAWDNGGATDAGAVTVGGPPWSAAPFKGTISATNSLVGSSTNDQVGSGGITLVQAGGVLILSPRWDNGSAADAGAVTLSSVTDGISPTVGAVSATNSLVGSSTNDQVGIGGAFPLGPEDIVVFSPLWNNGTVTEAGAVTVTSLHGLYPPLIGVLSSANSLVGSSSNDQVGIGNILGLPNSAYVFHSPLWDNGAATDAGAVTLVEHGRSTGVISSANSLVGSSPNDKIGSGGSIPLRPNSFVVLSPAWNNGSIVDAGAATVGGINRPLIGAVSSTNSYVGSTTNDQVGSGGAKPVSQGYGIVHSPLWDNRTAVDAGAVTWVSDSSAGGFITKDNSLVGSHSNDQIGSGGITVQAAPLVTIRSPNWCYGAGAVTHVTSLPLYGHVWGYNSIVGAETAEPEFALQQPVTHDVAHHSTQTFPPASVGASTPLTYTITNRGTDDMWLTIGGYGGPVVFTGTDASMFSVSSQPPMIIVAGDTTSFTVNFRPTSAGSKTATLALVPNNDPAHPFQVFLTGSGLPVPLTDWRQTHFGSNANTGAGADAEDFDHDGISNLVEYAFGLPPAQSGTGRPPLAQRNSGNFVTTFTEPGYVTGVTYGAEWSTSLASGSWQPVTDTGAAPQHVFSVPIGGNQKIFMRLKVTPAPAP